VHVATYVTIKGWVLDYGQKSTQSKTKEELLLWVKDDVLLHCTQELAAMIDLDTTGTMNSYSTLFKLEIAVRGGTSACWAVKNRLDQLRVGGATIGSCSNWTTQVQPPVSLKLQFSTGGKITSTYERYGIGPELIHREWNPLRMYVRGADGAGGVKTLLHTWSEKNGHFIVRDVLKKMLGSQSESCEQICAELDS
jgi:hypothetical protein